MFRSVYGLEVIGYLTMVPKWYQVQYWQWPVDERSLWASPRLSATSEAAKLEDGTLPSTPPPTLTFALCLSPSSSNTVISFAHYVRLGERRDCTWEAT